MRRRMLNLCGAGVVLLALAALAFSAALVLALSTGQVLAFRSRGTGIVDLTLATAPASFWIYVSIWAVGCLLSVYAAAKLRALSLALRKPE